MNSLEFFKDIVIENVSEQCVSIWLYSHTLSDYCNLIFNFNGNTLSEIITGNIIFSMEDLLCGDLTVAEGVYRMGYMGISFVRFIRMFYMSYFSLI